MIGSGEQQVEWEVLRGLGGSGFEGLFVSHRRVRTLSDFISQAWESASSFEQVALMLSSALLTRSPRHLGYSLRTAGSQ